MAASKTWELRQRTKRPDYKEPKETDIVAVRTKAKTKPDNLYPIEVVDEDLTRFKVHYVGFSSSDDEWRVKEDVVDISEDFGGPERIIQKFSLYKELAARIKSALNSCRKESPVVRIDMPFDKLEFDGGLGQYGKEKRCVRAVQHYAISAFQDLNPLLGIDWHFRGINMNGDFCHVILSTVEFYLYRRRAVKEYIPVASADSVEVKEISRDIGDMLVFSFVKGNGTRNQFGTDKTIFVN